MSSSGNEASNEAESSSRALTEYESSGNEHSREGRSISLSPISSSGTGTPMDRNASTNEERAGDQPETRPRSTSRSLSSSPEPCADWHFDIYDVPALPSSDWPDEQIWRHAQNMTLWAHSADERDRWTRTMNALETCTCETREIFVPDHLRSFRPIYSKHTVRDYLMTNEEHRREHGIKMKVAQTTVSDIPEWTPSTIETGPPCMRDPVPLPEPCCKLWNFHGPGFHERHRL